MALAGSLSIRQNRDQTSPKPHQMRPGSPKTLKGLASVLRSTRCSVLAAAPAAAEAAAVRASAAAGEEEEALGSSGGGKGPAPPSASCAVSGKGPLPRPWHIFVNMPLDFLSSSFCSPWASLSSFRASRFWGSNSMTFLRSFMHSMKSLSSKTACALRNRALTESGSSLSTLLQQDFAAVQFFSFNWQAAWFKSQTFFKAFAFALFSSAKFSM
mmetsp:Transcript_125286/g.315594  ORF Transcript_125286/g.315594 Transcript_125286/m.315594 type:complete len:213 (+) Transcript_125286:37-675(+)